MPRPVTIHLHPDAPAKPSVGSACNGCGACCAFEPCPLGIWIGRRRRGPCPALRWQADAGRHVCGALLEPRHHLPLLPESAGRWLVRRWIGAGIGCDAALEVLGPG